MSDLNALVEHLKHRASSLGFDAFGIAPADARHDLPEKLRHALEHGYHAEMEWMAETEDRRSHPLNLWPEARSIILLGMNYGPETNPMDLLEEKDVGILSAYARNRDYHEIIKGRLKELAGILARRAEADVKVFVDTAPLMEKPLAQEAGLGWQGKHTVLVSRTMGSWSFLGAILTTAVLPYDKPHKESCGSCTRCLEACPTNAFPAPFQLDARKCLAYYSVEHKGQIPRELRTPMGNRIYGCDDCLAVCPWNKFAKVAHEAKLVGRPELERPKLADLVKLDEAGFRELFAGSPIKRIGHARFLRNVLIGIGNSGNAEHLPDVMKRLADPSPLIRGAAVWALRKLSPEAAESWKQRQAEVEVDPEVEAEWEGAV